MDNSVIIKANNSGIILIMDDEIPFSELKEKMILKLKETSEFLGEARVVLAFRGRELSPKEQRELLDIICEHSALQVMCVLDEDEGREALFEEKLNEKMAELDNRTGMFYKGNVRSGQELQFEESVVIMGDVNNGATIMSKGNIVVLGALKGSAYAGVTDNYHAFVAALQMEPVQIRIGSLIARSPEQQDGSEKVPKIAFAEDGAIYIEPITRTVMNEIQLD